jgi:hypothetical protein
LKDFVPAIAAVIAGIFAIVSPFITWKLKNASDERARLVALDKERRDDIKRLYTNIFALFEQAIRQVMHAEEFTLAREFTEANAKINLLASPEIAAQYNDACSLLEGLVTASLQNPPSPTETWRANRYVDCFFQGMTSGYAAREVRCVGPITGGGLFEEDQKFVHGTSACFIIDFSVFGGISSDSCPATVTFPGFWG